MILDDAPITIFFFSPSAPLYHGHLQLCPTAWVRDIGVQDRPIRRLRGRRNIQSRVPFKEARRLQMDADLLDRHDREVLRAGVVRQGKGVPEDKVLITDVIPRADHNSTLSLSRLCQVNSPAAYSSSSRYWVTQTGCCENLARLAV